MAITCPRCKAEFDATLFQFGHCVCCGCGAEVRYPDVDLRGGHREVEAKLPRKSLPQEKGPTNYGVSTFQADTL